MSRPKLPPGQKKDTIKITLDPDVLAAARASGNVSRWLNEAGRRHMRAESRATDKTIPVDGRAKTTSKKHRRTKETQSI